ELRRLADGGPWALDLDQVASALPRGPLGGKNEWRRFPIRPHGSLIGRVLYLSEELPRRRRQRHSVELFLLGKGGGLRPDAFLEVELIPGRAEDLAPTRAGQQQQPDRVGRGLIRVNGQGIGEPAELVAGEVPVALLLGVPLKPPAGVVGTHLPSGRRQAEHLRQQRRGS